MSSADVSIPERSHSTTHFGADATVPDIPHSTHLKLESIPSHLSIAHPTASQIICHPVQSLHNASLAIVDTLFHL